MNLNKGAAKSAASLQQFAADFFKKPDFTVFLSAASLQQSFAAPLLKTLILRGFYSLPRGGWETLRPVGARGFPNPPSRWLTDFSDSKPKPETKQR